MVEVAIIGGSEFVLGFQLAGIRKTIEAKDAPMGHIKKLMQDEHIGIIIIDDKTMDKLDFHDRKDVEGSISPVFVELSTQLSMESLKKMIKKSIGIDLMKT